MGWMLATRARLRQWFRRSAAEERMDEEIRFHIEMETERLVREGVAPDEARRRAVVAFGGVEKHREEMRAGWRVPVLENRVLDARYAARSLRRTPGFTLAVVLTLAVGIGAATAMYGVMSRLLLLPPPGVGHPERVVRLYFTERSGGGEPSTGSGQDYRYFMAVREGARTLSSVGAHTSGERVMGSGADARRVRVTLVSPGFWSTLDARPAAGRFFTDEEAAPVGGAAVVVLGHGVWLRDYGADPGVIGTMVRVGGRPYEVVGVAPRGFRGVEFRETELWLPISAYVSGLPEGLDWTEMVTGEWLHLVGRLAPGVTRERAGAELTALTRAHHEGRAARARAEEREPDPAWTPLTVSAAGVTGALGPDMRPIPEARVSVWLVGIAVVLLGAACVNVASLLLLRSMRRRREIAVRSALGMGRRRLAAQLFTESLILAVLGGAVALAVAVGGGAWIQRVLLPEIASGTGGLDGRMLAIAAASVIGTAILAGLAPLLQARRDPSDGLRDGARHGATARSPVLRALLVTQVALSVVLLAGAGLFLRSLQRIEALDLGFDRERVLVVTVDFAGSTHTPERLAEFWERALDRVRGMPGVERASLTGIAPLRLSFAGRELRFPGRVDSHIEQLGATYYSEVSPDFFATTGIRVLEGRDFLAEERSGPLAIVLNETLARAGWPDRSPVGECVPLADGSGCATVVGVVENSRRSELVEPSYLMYYRPLPAGPAPMKTLLLRVDSDARVGVASLRRALGEIEPALPYLHVEPLTAELEDDVRPWRLGASVFTAFGLLAILLAAVGLYSALAYAITQRTREIGIRLAIGARAPDVARMVMRDGVAIALAGIALGLLACLLGARSIAGLLFEVSATDRLVLGSVAISLLAVTLLAGVGPVRRALRVDPVVAMRVE